MGTPEPDVPDFGTILDESITSSKKHGNFEDISSEELKLERDQSNRAQFLADV